MLYSSGRHNSIISGWTLQDHHIHGHVSDVPAEASLPVPERCDKTENTEWRVPSIVLICQERLNREETCLQKAVPKSTQVSPVGSAAPPATTEASSEPLQHHHLSRRRAKKSLWKPAFITEVLSAVELVTPAREQHTTARQRWVNHGLWVAISQEADYAIAAASRLRGTETCKWLPIVSS